MVRGVVFDWAGTVVDFGSRAPVGALIALFSARGVAISEAQARGPMGLHKREHIRTLLKLPEVTAAWQQRQQRAWDEADVDALYAGLLPLTLAAVREHAALIPGVAELCAELRRRGLGIGSTTGYSAEMMAELVPLAARQGFAPDAVVTVSDVPAGRPAPWMCFRNAERLGIYPLSTLVKIGDTVADVGEGQMAGMWTIGYARCGNEVGLSETALAALPAAEQARLVAAARARLLEAGAHYVVDGPAEVLPVIDAIEARLRAGERP
jgi:phosphonoacetaldehyde hydrolase